jgi:hypothetical protein
MQDGEFIAQPMPVPATCAAAGLSWPTPTPTPRNQNEPLDEWLQRREREKALGRNGNGFGMPLDVAVRFFRSSNPWHVPTPTTADVYTGKMKSTQQSEGSMHSVTLSDFVKKLPMLPTPTTSQDYKPVRPLAPSEADGSHGTMLVGAVGDANPELIGESLNPDWETWLMGCPDGWTRLEPLPDGSYPEWLQIQRDGTWWAQWWGPWWMDCPATATAGKDTKPRLQLLGNGIVPASAALAIKDMSTW